MTMTAICPDCGGTMHQYTGYSVINDQGRFEDVNPPGAWCSECDGRTVPFPRPDLEAEIARLRAENERVTAERDEARVKWVENEGKVVALTLEGRACKADRAALAQRVAEDVREGVRKKLRELGVLADWWEIDVLDLEMRDFNLGPVVAAALKKEGE